MLFSTLVASRFRPAHRSRCVEAIVLSGRLKNGHDTSRRAGAAMNVVREWFSRHFSDPQVVALAKQEELLFVPNREEPIRLGRHHPGLRLCQAIRDEAHHR